MPCALIRIEKSCAGETWENTYGVIVASAKTATDSQPAYTSDMDEQLGFDVGANYSDARTNPNDGAYNPTALITALIAFERIIHSNNATVTKLTVTDGQFNTQAFRSVQLGYSCIQNIERVAPGNVCLLARRMPATISVKPGRAYYRLALSEDQVNPFGQKLIGLDDRAATAAYFATLINRSKLSDYYYGQTEGGAFVCLAIPQYEKFTGNDGRVHYNMSGAVAIEKLDNVDAVSRQVKRGRRRPVNP